MVSMEYSRSKVFPKKGFDRLAIVSMAFFVLFGIIMIRLFHLQVLQHRVYAAEAQGQRELTQELLPHRGQIYWKDGSTGQVYTAATNRLFWQLYAVPKDITNPQRVSHDLSVIVDIPEDVLLSKLDKPNDPYEPIQDRLADSQVEAVRALQFEGLGFREMEQRYYPESPMGSSVLGFVSWLSDEHKGQYGIEQQFEKILVGNAGSLHVENDIQGRPILVGERVVTNPVSGDDITLTIDRTIEYIACNALHQAVLSYQASGGSVIIVDPFSGSILAMCSAPEFDSNRYNEVDDSSWYLNQTVNYEYEPGSTFKAITAAIGLDIGEITPETTYEDTGQVRFGPHTIQNALGQKEGTQTMTQVLEKSLNTGAVWIGFKIGQERYLEGLKKFGFGTQTGIALPGEGGGNISSLEKKGDIYLATATFGQGITATPLQMAMAFTSLVNGGVLYKPRIIESIRKSDGSVQSVDSSVVRHPIQPRTSLLISGMLGAVVKEGYSGQARVPGYYVGGKSGTAQVAGNDGRYSGESIHSFIGFAPVDNPRFVILTKLDKVKTSSFAQGSALPLFKEIASFLLTYYGVPTSFDN
ncbi:MAG: Peptidoglycan glycosyltransferase [Parcubacteria group bacterium GW2011_GWA2_43_13]|nr:MAG: Peptidoglycan glycosyltransferase [Parcubacteria group bacterium GW2011_GWA2_43_13]OGY70260.1 MAG: hypothetical protein A2986_04320 [Candidatus Jacksonbacteria bacterium RIFCSPLOWO2_01_FULL_44_13]HAZ16972.1 hypothetical protein [Candidatus Jacksonbacteria bacterium]